VLCSKGYPEKFKKDVEIKNLNMFKTTNNNFYFHAGTINVNQKIYAIGGRVLNFVSLSKSFKDARKKVINNLKILNWNKGFYRKDIGYKVIDQ